MPCEEEKTDAKKGEGVAAQLLKARTILINGEVNSEMTQEVIAQLVVMDNESQDPIRVFITSQGGHVDSGYAIYDMLRFVRSDIITIGTGWVASIAVPILLSASKENRFSLANTRFLLHQPSGGAGGNASDIRIEAREIIKIRAKLNELISKETGQAIDKVASDSDRNFWMDPKEALDYGLIAKIVQTAEDIG
jgi:ATP-dependent Clp protease protease subunit